MTKIGYKIVFNTGGRFLSFIEGLVSLNSLGLEYIPNKPTTPKIAGSPLFLFESELDALDYKRKEGLINDSQFEIWKCEYKPHPNPYKRIFVGISSYTDEMIDELRALEKNRTLSSLFTIEPAGIQASEITLLEKVRSWE